MTNRRALQQFYEYQLQQEQRFVPRFEAILRSQINAVLRYIRQNSMQSAVANIEIIIPPTAIRRELAYLYRVVGTGGANLQWAQIRTWEQQEQKAFGLNRLWQQLMDTFFGIYGANKVVEIDDTTKAWIRKKLVEAEEQGSDYFTLARELRTSKIPLSRAKVIARTETVGASNAGKMTAARQSTLRMQKRWINSNDKRVRELHRNGPGGVGGETQPLEQPFSNNLMFPGDPTGRPKQVIQCRCTMTFEPMRGADGRFLRK